MRIFGARCCIHHAEGADFALGAVMLSAGRPCGNRRFAALADCLADDYQLAAGWRPRAIGSPWIVCGMLDKR